MKVTSVNEVMKDSVVSGIKRVVTKNISLNNGNLVTITDIFEPAYNKGPAVREAIMFDKNRKPVLQHFKVRIIDKLLKCVKR